MLICNAGVMELPALEQVYGVEKHFVINHLGHFILTHHLLGQVKAARQAAAEDAGSEEQQAESGDQPMTRAEEIRQRIAERREELRRAAEEGDGEQKTPAQVDYRQAIQAMMAGKKNQDKDESEQ